MALLAALAVAATGCDEDALEVLPLEGELELAGHIAGSSVTDLWGLRADGSELVHFDGRGWSAVPLPVAGLAPGALQYVSASGGALWVLVVSESAPLLLARVDPAGQRLDDFSQRLAEVGLVERFALLRGADGEVYLSFAPVMGGSGVAPDGQVVRLASDTFEFVSRTPPGAPVEFVRSPADIWVRDRAGALRGSGDSWAPFSMPALHPDSMVVASPDELWAWNTGLLWHFAGGRGQERPLPDPEPGAPLGAVWDIAASTGGSVALLRNRLVSAGSGVRADTVSQRWNGDAPGAEKVLVFRATECVGLQQEACARASAPVVGRLLDGSTIHRHDRVSTSRGVATVERRLLVGRPGDY